MSEHIILQMNTIFLELGMEPEGNSLPFQCVYGITMSYVGLNSIHV